MICMKRASSRAASFSGRRPFRTLASFAIPLAAALTFPVAASAQQASVSIQGSTTFNAQIIKPFQSRIQSRSGITLEVLPNKSVYGLIAVLEKRADMAMISADMASEVAAARIKSPALPYDQLKSFQIDLTRVAFVVNRSNPLRSLSHAQVRAILTGEIGNWKSLGGPDKQIRVVATQNGGGTVAAVRAQLLDQEQISAPNAIRLESPGHVIKVVEQEEGAFGITQLGLATKSGTIILDTGPAVEQQLNFVTLGEPSPKARAVIETARSLATEQNLAEHE